MNKTRGYQVLHDRVVHMSATDGDSIVEAAFQYNDSYNENIVSFANNIHTVDGGVHENAFKTAVTRIFNDYARRHSMLKDADANLKGDDVREGMTAVVSVKLKDAQFEGQTKAKLGNTFIGPLVNSLLNDKLVPFLEENPAVAKAILEKSINAARVREAAQRARELAGKKAVSPIPGCRKNSPTVSGATPGGPNCILSRATRPEAPPFRGGTAISRRSSRCGARCSTWKRHGWTVSMATTSSCRW